MITSIPILGTSWYERRANYWLRRIWFTLFLIMVCAAFGGVDTGFLIGLHARGGALWTVLGILVAYILGSGSYIFIGLSKQRLARPRSRTRRAGHFGAGLGILARSGFLLAQVFIVVVSLVCGGLTLAHLVRSFLPEIDNERWARNAIADQLDEEARIIERNRQRQARRQAAIQRTSDDHT